MAKNLNINSIRIVGVDSVVIKNMSRRFFYTYEDTDLSKTISSRSFVSLLKDDTISEALVKAQSVANSELV
jgi:hypothetical protein